MEVLIIRLSALGDIIHGIPAAARIKERLPECRISWLVEPAGVPLLTANPVVDRVICLPRRSWMNQTRNPARIPAVTRDIWGFFKEFRNTEYDAVIDLQGLLKSAVWALGANSKRRIGFKGTREGAEYLLTDSLRVGDYFGNGRHVVEHNLDLADYACDLLGALPPAGKRQAQFSLPSPLPEETNIVEELLGFGSAGSQALSKQVVLIPGTTWDTKIWPSDKWAELAIKLFDKFNMRAVLVGGQAECSFNNRIEQQIRQCVPLAQPLNLTGKTSLGELICLYRQANLVIGADTGPVHLAAAVGATPVVAVIGATPKKRNGPYGRDCYSIDLGLSCQPCFKKVCPLGTRACLEELTVEHVFAAIVAQNYKL